MLYKIYLHFKDLQKIIIGKQHPNFNFSNIPNTTVISKLCNNDKVKQYLNTSEMLILPSYFEAGSLILLEAIEQGHIIGFQIRAVLAFMLGE